MSQASSKEGKKSTTWIVDLTGLNKLIFILIIK